jgi:hypothetical protein
MTESDEHSARRRGGPMIGDRVEALQRQGDESLEALLGAFDVIDAASSRLAETENAIFELAGGSRDSDPSEPLLAELADETRTVDLRLALGVVHAWLTRRNNLSTWLSDSDLADVDPGGLRAALQGTP